MIKKIVSLILALALLSSAFVGCGNNQSNSSAVASGGKVAEPQTLTVCIGPEPETIDPALNSTVDGATLMIHAFEGLYSMDKNNQPALAQAKSEKVSDDKLTYTLTLRDDIKWSDGKAVTAGDFVYSWQRAVDPKTASPYAYLYDFIVNGPEIRDGKKQPSELGVRAIDDKTIEIKLAKVCGYFNKLLAFPTFMPVREDMIEAKGDKWTQNSASYLSNGPYMLKNWSHKENLTYVKNPYYYNKDKITMDTLRFVLLEDDGAILAAYQNDEIATDYTIPIDEVEAWKEKSEYHKLDQIGTYYVVFNVSKAPFDNPKVRKALSLAIDRNYIVSKVTKFDQKPANSFVSVGVTEADGTKQFHDLATSYYSTKAEDYEKNVAEAKKLLTEAGYPDGKGLPAFEYSTNPASPHLEITEALQNMWKTELGVTCTIAQQEWSVFSASRRKGDFTVARDGWVADYDDPTSFLEIFLGNADNNEAQFKDKTYDSLIDQIHNTADETKRFELMHKAEDYLMDQLPGAPLFYYTDNYLMKDYVKGYYESPLGYKYFMYTTIEK
jgi:oligopeptide transport system substrate-binding protein